MTKTALICISFLLVIVAAIYGPKAVRLYKLANLYNEDKIASNFINIDKIFQVSKPIPSSHIPHCMHPRSTSRSQAAGVESTSASHAAR